VAFEADCPNLVAVDLEGNGKTDLAMISQQAFPETKFHLRLFRNEIPEQGNWIAFSFQEAPGHISPIGATVRLSSPGFTNVATVVTGDSFRSQHPLTAHFGLGNVDSVERVEIRWPGGAVTHLAGPKINQAHSVSAPER
jgi:hypothetical protein